MIVLSVVGVTHWLRIGNSQLKENWLEHQAPSPGAIARQVYYGICLGMLGLTGFECKHRLLRHDHN